MYTYFCQNRPFRTSFFPQEHTRMSLHQNISKILTQWQPSQTFGHMQQTQRKKRIIYKHFRNLNSIYKETCNVLLRVFILVRRLVF